MSEKNLNKKKMKEFLNYFSSQSLTNTQEKNKKFYVMRNKLERRISLLGIEKKNRERKKNVSKNIKKPLINVKSISFRLIQKGKEKKDGN